MDKIVAVVDRSGSMGKIRDDAQGGLNEFIREQQEANTGALFTLAEFDGEYNLVYNDGDIKLFDSYVLKPRGSTALFDAIGRTANSVKGSKVSGKKIFMIITDGKDNSSREFSSAAVRALIEEMRSDDWEFLFIGADETALNQAASIGLDMNTVFRNDNTGMGIRDSYRTAAFYSSSLRGGVSKNSAIDAMNATIAGSATMSKAAGFDVRTEDTEDDKGVRTGSDG